MSSFNLIKFRISWTDSHVYNGPTNQTASAQTEHRRSEPLEFNEA